MCVLVDYSRKTNREGKASDYSIEAKNETENKEEIGRNNVEFTFK